MRSSDDTAESIKDLTKQGALAAGTMAGRVSLLNLVETGWYKQKLLSIWAIPVFPKYLPKYYLTRCYLSQQFRDKGIVVFHVTYEQSEFRL